MGSAGRLVGACLLASLLQAALATKLQVCSPLSTFLTARSLRRWSGGAPGQLLPPTAAPLPAPLR